MRQLRYLVYATFTSVLILCTSGKREGKAHVTKNESTPRYVSWLNALYTSGKWEGNSYVTENEKTFRYVLRLNTRDVSIPENDWQLQIKCISGADTIRQFLKIVDFTITRVCEKKTNYFVHGVNEKNKEELDIIWPKDLSDPKFEIGKRRQIFAIQSIWYGHCPDVNMIQFVSLNHPDFYPYTFVEEDTLSYKGTYNLFDTIPYKLYYYVNAPVPKP